MLEMLKSKTMIIFILIVFGFAYIDGVTNTDVKKLDNENIQLINE